MGILIQGINGPVSGKAWNVMLTAHRYWHCYGADAHTLQDQKD